MSRKKGASSFVNAEAGEKEWGKKEGAKREREEDGLQTRGTTRVVMRP